MVTSPPSGLASGARTFAGLVLLVLGTAATLVTALGFLGDRWWGFDLVANLRFPAAVVLLLAGIVYGLVFGRGAAAVFVVAALVDAALLAPLWLTRPPRPTATARLVVATYDAHHDPSRRNQVVEWLRTLEADVVFLQDTTDAWVEALAAAGLPYRIVATPLPETATGTIALSRTSVDARAYPLGAGRDPVVEIQTSLAGAELTILNVRSPFPTDATAASAQRDLFLRLADITRERTRPTLLIGDLGTTRWTSVFAILTRSGALTDSEEGHGYQGTWPARDWPLLEALVALPVDHALTSSSLTTVRRETGPRLGTSQRPLVVELAPASG